MRLTIFNITDIDISKYQKSIDRILNGYSIPKESSRKTYVAIFNGSVLGIASAKGSVIDYFNVLEITRRRGVGSYLLQVFCNDILKFHPELTISESMSSIPDFIIFSEKYGFINKKSSKAIKLF